MKNEFIPALSHRFSILLITVALLSSCALGTTELVVDHDPLEKITAKNQGNLVVRQFSDKREITEYIGNKRNGFGMVIGHVGLEQGKQLEVMITRFFAEALQEAGYNVTVLKGPSEPIPAQMKVDAVIDGEIKTFWMDLYMAVWHSVGVKVRALEPETQKVLWEDMIEGEEKRVLWVGATAEYERIVREALTIALNRATEKFASENFSAAIKKR